MKGNVDGFGVNKENLYRVTDLEFPHSVRKHLKRSGVTIEIQSRNRIIQKGLSGIVLSIEQVTLRLEYTAAACLAVLEQQEGIIKSLLS